MPVPGDFTDLSETDVKNAVAQKSDADPGNRNRRHAKPISNRRHDHHGRCQCRDLAEPDETRRGSRQPETIHERADLQRHRARANMCDGGPDRYGERQQHKVRWQTP